MFRANRFRGKEKIASEKRKFCRIGINFDRNKIRSKRNDERGASYAGANGNFPRPVVRNPTGNDKFCPRVQRRSSRAFSYISPSRARARACVYVLGKMISLVPRGKAAETMRERVVARLSSSVVNNIGQNF